MKKKNLTENYVKFNCTKCPIVQLRIGIVPLAVEIGTFTLVDVIVNGRKYFCCKDSIKDVCNCTLLFDLTISFFNLNQLETVTIDTFFTRRKFCQNPEFK